MNGKVTLVTEMTATIGEFVAKATPFPLDNADKTGDGPCAGIQAQLGQAGELSRPIPAIGAMDKDMTRSTVNGVNNLSGPAKDA